jgi:hypothetical protein
LKLIYDRQSIGQSVLVSGAHLEPVTNFSFSLKFPLGSCGFVFCSGLSDEEDGSVVYCSIASGPCQISRSWAAVSQNSWPYFTVSSETPPTWRARFPYLYPPGTGWPSYTPGHWIPFLWPLSTRRDCGGSILTRLHTGWEVKVKVTLRPTSVSMFWCLAQSGTFDQRFFFFNSAIYTMYRARSVQA